MQTPEKAAERIMEVLPRLHDYANGEFVDVREIIAPEEYRALMAQRLPPPGCACARPGCGGSSPWRGLIPSRL